MKLFDETKDLFSKPVIFFDYVSVVFRNTVGCLVCQGLFSKFVDNKVKKNQTNTVKTNQRTCYKQSGHVTGELDMLQATDKIKKLRIEKEKVYIIHI